MAVQTGIPKTAAGNASDTGTPVSKPPTEEAARSTSFGRTNFGANAYAGPASLPSGQKHTSTLATNDDPVRNAVIAKGVAGTDAQNSQTRRIAAGNVPAHPAMAARSASDGSPGGPIPPRLGMNKSVAPLKP